MIKIILPDVKITFNGTKSEQTIISRQVWTKDLKQNDGNNSLIVENTSDKPLYVTTTRKGVPMVSDIAREDKGLSMKVDYYDLDTETH